MGLLDNLKAKLGPAKEKVGDLAQQHGGKIEQGLDKAARTVDQRTKGKYSDKIDSGTRKAKEAVDKLGQKDGGTPGTPGAPDAPGSTPGGSGTTPPPPPPAH
ncbi:antitoxin [Streptomyces sp. NPDC006856]|uniref:antitoxin n=1 Tax=unclassified Streptomyces TaxID=2593676 RepID=UPI0036A0936F